MIGGFPKRPQGNDAQTQFLQWVYDTLLSLRILETPGALTTRTTRGFYSIPKKRGGGGPSGDVLPVWL